MSPGKTQPISVEFFLDGSVQGAKRKAGAWAPVLVGWTTGRIRRGTKLGIAHYLGQVAVQVSQLAGDHLGPGLFFGEFSKFGGFPLE
jgi:hypothetical protein